MRPIGGGVQAPRGRGDRADRGAVLVEMALVLPILVMLVFGIYWFGIAYHTKQALQAAAREGARELALRHPDNVEAAVLAAAPSVDGISIAQTACPATGDGQATVTVSADVDLGIPYVFTGTKTLTAQAVMRCGL